MTRRPSPTTQRAVATIAHLGNERYKAEFMLSSKFGSLAECVEWLQKALAKFADAVREVDKLRVDHRRPAPVDLTPADPEEERRKVREALDELSLTFDEGDGP